jgi:hypothetical protein
VNSDAPKIFGALVHPGGESDTRAMARVDMPFMHAIEPSHTAEKSGSFYEVIVKEGEPYLFGPYVVALSSGDTVEPAVVLNPELALKEPANLTRLYLTASGQSFDYHTALQFIGDGYATRYQVDNANDLDPNASAWPGIDRLPKPGRQYLSSEDGAARHSISYIDTALLTGGAGYRFRQPGFAATGFIDKEQGYGFIYSDMHWEDEDNPLTTGVPIAWCASTRGLTMTRVAVPYYPTCHHFAHRVQAVGKGRARALMAVADRALSATLRNPLLPPWMNVTGSHGANWGTSTTEWLAPYLFMYPANYQGASYDRPYYDNDQLESITSNALFSYVGGESHTHFLVISHGYTGLKTSDLGVPPPMDDFNVFCPMLFRVDETGTSYSRVNWPCDTWYTVRAALGGFSEIPSDGFRLIGAPFLGGPLTRHAHWSFGAGCFALSIYKRESESEPFKFYLMFTRDFGTSWQFSTELPDVLVPRFTNINGAGLYQTGPTLVMIRPYESEKKKGRILLAGQDHVANQQRAVVGLGPDNDKLLLYSTDGDFQQFKRIARIGIGGDFLNGRGAPKGYTFVNYGNRQYTPYIWPAHPGVMEP